ncbi:MAG: L,D-transpeptidase family protein [Rhizobiales bacterium]|nr:L,D-transpeptidase family protein [Hyphomicrobiales bacterium]
MSKVNKFLFSALAISVASSGIAYAETQERTFRNAKKKPTISRSGQIGSNFTFWGSGWGSGWNRNRSSFGELPVNPDGDTSVKIYTYAPDRLHALADRNAKQPEQARPVFATDAPADYDPTPAELRGTKLDDSLAQTIFDHLKAGQAGIKVTKKQRSAITEFYRKRGYKAVWTSMDGLEDGAHLILDVLRQADTEGLQVSDYKVPELARTEDNIAAIESDLGALARLDIQLTALAVRYAQHASGGRVVANRLSGYHDLKPPRVAAATALTRLAETDQPDEYLQSLHPRHPSYARLKAALKEVRSSTQMVEVVEPIPAGPTIRPGQYDERIPAIRKRLIKDGHLEARNVEIIPTTGQEIPGAEPAVITDNVDGDSLTDEAVYQDELIEAVKDFQRTAGLKPDGIIGRRTISAFNGQAEKHFDKAARIVANMERLRWLPRYLGSSYVFVNQASYKLRVMRDGREVWRTKVIVGKPSNQTSFFSDEMETVVFNPYWGVPQSIITKEMLPKLVNDPGYLDRLGYEVYSGSGQRTSSYNIDWWNYYGQAPVAVRQPPGNGNALGRIKFLFPNKHAIYLHDTPTKKLFNRENRAYSHGCVRVQDPTKLAEAVLGWDQNRIASRISTGRNQKVTLKTKVPVHLTYFTAWPDAAGSVDYHKDVYGRDRRLELAFQATSATFR